MGETAAGRDGPRWLGLGWVGSGVIGGAAGGILLGAVLGVLLSVTSDRSPDDAATAELPLLLGIAVGAAALLPAGVPGRTASRPGPAARRRAVATRRRGARR